ncbi:MAG: lipopolysaccharide biosynthesis protein [Solirubrobacterales bacterium]
MTLFTRDAPSSIAVANMVAAGLALLSAPLIARGLGPDGRGQTASVLAAFLIVPIILSLGVPVELRRRCIDAHTDPLVRAARIYYAVAFLPAITLAFLLDKTLFASLSGASAIASFIGISLSPLSMSWLGDTSVLVARGKFRRVMAVRLVQPVLVLFAIIAAMAFDAISVAFVIGVNVGAIAITCVVAANLTRVSILGRTDDPVPLLKGGLKFAGSSIAEASSNRLDQVLVLPILGSYGAGIYSVAVTLGAIPIALAHAMAAGYFRDIAQSDVRDRAAVVRTSIRGTTSVAVIACGALALLSPPFIPLVFGKDFVPSIVPAEIALLGSVAMVIGYVAAMALIVEERGRRMTVVQVVSLGFAIGALLVLGPPYGATGAAIASTIGFVLMAVGMLSGISISPIHLVPTPAHVRSAIRRLFASDTNP